MGECPFYTGKPVEDFLMDDYLEEKRLRLLERVKPEEWDFLERFKKGELLGEKRPLHAYAYDKFLGFANQFEKWVEEQM